MSSRLSLRDLTVKDKKVLLRVDFNVPIDENGKITDDTRIQSTLPTLRYILEQGGSVILISHLGRPKGEKNTKFSLKPVAKRLEEILGEKVKMASDSIGDEVKELSEELKPGELLMLENVRFYKAEENPGEDLTFAQKLAQLGDLYVNDAFGCAHRAHSTIVNLAHYFPGKSAAGFLMEKEIEFLGEALLNPKHPFYAILGGAKISTKIGVIKSLIEKVERLFIGGAMSYTFLKAQGLNIGDSLCQDEYLEEVKKLLNQAKNKGCSLELPVDHVIVEDINEKADSKIASTSDGIPDGYKGVDIGPETIKKYSSDLIHAKTVFWNGPLGVFEIEGLSKGTFAITKLLAGMDATVVVGGGESVSAIQKSGLGDKFAHLSTGGGASLEFIQYGTLPGVEALSEKVRA